jgi:ABC-2 type transport system permease protein
MRHDTSLRTLALVRHNSTLLLREPGPMISRLVLPVVAVIVFEPLYRSALAGQGRAAGIAQAVTGVLVLFSLLALSIVGTSILTERSWHTWDRVRATPARPLELLAGKAVPAFALLLLQQALVLGLGVVVLGMHVASLGLLAIASVVWALTLMGIGTMLGTLLRSQSEFSSVQDIGSFLSTGLGGALVPLAAMPGWLRDFAPISPAYWAMRALNAAANGAAGELWHAIGVLLAIGVAAGGIAAWRIGRGWGRSAML